MQLKFARLCLDCSEVHEAQECPVCTSEAFAYLTRWVSAPEFRIQPRPATSPAAEVYRELTSPKSAPRRSKLVTGAVGATMIAMAGWMWRANLKNGTPASEGSTNDPEAPPSDKPAGA